MFNVTIINAKKSIMKIAIIIGIIIVLFVVTKMINKFKTNEVLQINLSEELVSCLNSEIPAMASTNYISNNVIKEDKEEYEETFAGKILNIELARVSQIKQPPIEQAKDENQIDETNDNNEQNSENKNEETQPVSTEVGTQVVTQNPIKENSNVEIGGVKIKNETDFEINDSIMNTGIDINKENITIFHTHTCESYTPTEQYNYQQTGNFRTTDLNYSVARVGDELTNYLMEYGFNVIHDKTYHDYPAYTGSYTRSQKTVENILNNNSSDIIIDLHRDAIGSNNNYAPAVKIGDETAARIMFVMGSNGGGLWHPNWQQNLKFAIKIQQKSNELYPGFAKPIMFRNSRYNQQLAKAACIIEVGSTGNTLEECLNSMKYLAFIMKEALK